MTIYLTVFNFAMLCLWVYDNTELGAMFKENGYRPGDIILIIVFILFAISVLEYVLIGRDRDE